MISKRWIVGVGLAAVLAVPCVGLARTRHGYRPVSRAAVTPARRPAVIAPLSASPVVHKATVKHFKAKHVAKRSHKPAK